MYTVTISSKGQIVLPQAVRRKLGLQEGDKLEVSLEGQAVLLTPLPVEHVAGWQRWRGELAGADALAEHLAGVSAATKQ